MLRRVLENDPMTARPTHLVRVRVLILVLFSLLGLASCGGGGGGGGSSETVVTTSVTPVTTSSLVLSLPRQGLVAAELALIVAEGDALSEAVAAQYQTARGVPAANIIRVKLSTASEVISAADFALLKADIDAKLPAGVQATLLTWASPSRVAGDCAMSITSAMAFGFDPKYCVSTGGCVATAASPYFDSESTRPWTDHGMRPSMMLGARTLDAARTLTARGLAADASLPGGDGYLLRSSDTLRSVRYTDQAALPAQWAGSLALNYLDNAAGTGSNSISGKSNVLFYFTGLVQVPDLASNSFRPGAIADHLTSFGGHLPSGGGQMPITAWLDAGATASYGTVEEPCNYAEKFSRASVLIDQYWRGATLIEAYWKSVQWPGQGLFIGEPLAQPFRDAPSLVISGGQYVITTRHLRNGSRYTLEYRLSASGSWTSLASFTGTRGQLQSLRAPLPPVEATQLRWVGPCPANSSQQCTLAQSA